MLDKDMVAEEIRATHLRAVDAFNRGDARAFAAGFSPDCWQFMPGQSPRIGRDLILADMEGHAIVSSVEEGANGGAFFTINPEDLQVITETVAIERGRYTITGEPTDGGPVSEEAVLETGYYMVVWKRDPQGAWLVHWDMVQNKT